jgi:hypothetical protein
MICGVSLEFGVILSLCIYGFYSNKYLMLDSLLGPNFEYFMY